MATPRHPATIAVLDCFSRLFRHCQSCVLSGLPEAFLGTQGHIVYTKPGRYTQCVRG